MAKFNVKDTRSAVRGPIVTEATPSGKTYEGASGYARDAKSELFLLAVSNMVGEDTFYEKAGDRDNRYARLVADVAVADPGWMLGFLGWLRSEGNMRSASLVGAAEAVKARLDAAKNGEVPNGARNRQLVSAVLQRADEPGEMLAYWVSHYGRAIPKPVKRGVADAVQRLYTEFNLLKYDTDSKGFRFGDVIDLVHPDAKAPWQGELFSLALDRRHNRAATELEHLPMVVRNRGLREQTETDPTHLLDAELLRGAGMTWEDALSLVGSKVDKRQLWEALIPTMGYMALLRNLRNFDEAGVSDEVASQVALRLADPEQVKRSRQFPYRFLAAYEQAPSLRWSHPLDVALNHCLANIPVLTGRTLVLIDTSASMTNGSFSARSKMTPANAAAVFGVALAARCGADLYGFANGQFRHDVPKGASVIREVGRFVQRTGEVGHGTEIALAVRSTFNRHDRVFILSDMQTFQDYRGDVGSAVPPPTAMYGFNLGGYQHTAYSTTGSRHEFGGLTDATFRMVPLLEAGRNAAWPWLDAAG